MESTNTKCKQIDELLSAFHDGEVTPAERTDVEQHLAECPVCVQKLADIGRLVESLRGMPRVAAPAGLSDRLDGIVSQRNNVVAWRQRGLRIAVGVAAAAVVAVGVRSWMGTTSQRTETAKVPTSVPAVAQSPNTVKPAVVAEKLDPVKTPTANTDTVKAPIVAQRPQEDDSYLPPAARIRTNPNGTVSGVPPEINVKEFDKAWYAKHPEDRPKVPATQHKQEPTMIASAVKPTTTDSSGNEAIAELPTTTNSFADAVGLATDEDGLYDIQM